MGRRGAHKPKARIEKRRAMWIGSWDRERGHCRRPFRLEPVSYEPWDDIRIRDTADRRGHRAINPRLRGIIPRLNGGKEAGM